MLTFRTGPGLSKLLTRMQDAADLLIPNVADGMSKLGEQTVTDLQTVTPTGVDLFDAYHPPPGDAAGHLNESYSVPNIDVTDTGAMAQVITDQPTKFRFVTTGTGVYSPGGFGSPIVPTVQKALYWQGAPHPFRSVLGQAANPFQQQVLAMLPAQGTAVFLEALRLTFGGGA